MTNVINQFKIMAVGMTRDDCIDALDRAGLGILENIGGAPWQVPDDDIKKMPAQMVSLAMADSEGFCYVGMRTYDFRGPAVMVPGQSYHDGNKVQAHNE